MSENQTIFKSFVVDFDAIIELGAGFDEYFKKHPEEKKDFPHCNAPKTFKLKKFKNRNMFIGKQTESFSKLLRILSIEPDSAFLEAEYYFMPSGEGKIYEYKNDTCSIAFDFHIEPTAQIETCKIQVSFPIEIGQEVINTICELLNNSRYVVKTIYDGDFEKLNAYIATSNSTIFRTVHKTKNNININGFKSIKFSKLITIGLCVFLTLIIIRIFGMLWYSGVFVSDRSAIVHVEGMKWNGKDYSRIGGEYTEGRTIAKSDNGWKINEIKEDPSHTFVVVRSFLDQYLYVADDYEIQTNGNITKVCWDGEYIDNKEFISALTEIDSIKTTSFDYEIEEPIFVVNDNKKMKPLRFAYEGCPVATVHKGYLGKINGKWVITTYISSNQYNDDGSYKPYAVGCYLIPDKYSNILKKYFIE